MASKPWGNKIRYGEFEIVGAREKRPRLMGEGSFGKTFEAERQDVVAGSVIKTSVALKVLNPALLSSESKKVQFVKEMLALTRFKHPNLIHYIRCGDEEDEVFYAMELCRGGDLAKLVKRYGPLPERVAALIGLQVAAGLREVHQRQRLVHRDIKPSNIMLVDELEKSLGVQHLAKRFEEMDSLCRIVDFGLVDFALNAQEEGSVPLRQRFAGSPMYASPEQVREQPVDGRSDIYSLGLTLWYLVQGKGPLLDAKGAELRDQKEAMRRHTDESTRHEASFPENLSEPFRQLLARMVAKRPEERFASAGELQTALRKYLDETVEQAAAPGFNVTRTSRPLEDVYRLGEEFPSRIGKKCFRAVEATTGHEVKLTMVEDLESDRVTVDVETVTEHLAGLAELTWAQDFPDTMLRVSEVIHSSDMLAFAEELPGGLPLSEVLRARARERRPVSFAEAVVLLRPVAEALDYLIQHGCTKVYLPCEDVWVLSEQIARQATGSGPAVMLPFAEWETPQVRFSMVTLPTADAESSVMGTLHQTASGSMQSSEGSEHPITVFARLLYRILNGSEIATAAAYLPTAYVQAASLGAASNNLIRDLVCQMTERQNVGAVLTEICINEGVIQPSRQPTAFGNTRGGTIRTHLPSQQPSTVYPAGAGSAQVSAAGSHTLGTHATAGTHSAASRTAGAHTVAAPASGTQSHLPPSITHSARPPSSATAVPARQTATNFGTQSVGGSSMLGGDTINISGEEICQVVRAAEVISPYDRERRVIKLQASQWMPLGKVRCPYSQRFFRLPKKLDPLPAIVVAPGLIHSPYADPGQNMRVAWEHWVPGMELICSDTGKGIVLPQELPLPEGILPPGTTGRVMSPYAPGEQFAVSADYWQPGIEVLCPITGHAFLMPRELPPLEAIAELNKPGVLTSPYAPTVSWQIPPPDWTAGRRLVCPSSHKEVVLPVVVERWVPEARVADLGQRLVYDPFDPGATIQVQGASWMPENIVKIGEGERGLRLPSDLPPLDAEIVPGRDDAVRSPYTGETVLVALEDWLPGKFIRCPRTGVDMVLPDSLPRRIPQGTISAAKRGHAISPFAPDREFRVPPEQWIAGGEVTCPATGRAFLLPPSLPLLEGSVPVGRLGAVVSPFAAKTEVAVAIEDWEPGKRLKCPVTGREFQLPADLEEWIEDGEWIAMQPGMIRSPLKPNPAVAVPESSWQAGALIAAPGTSRRFRIPAGAPLPSLALERAALAQALAEPESSDADAAASLGKTFPETTSKLVRSIRMRHRMASTEERLRAQETGEALPNEPGYVRSPYGSRPRIVVPPAKWVEPGASIHCTETGRRFLLPPSLPPLTASLDPARPGWVISPFDASQPFEIEPGEWEPGRAIQCALTGHPLRLPAKLPEWKPVAEVPEGHAGEVVSPFAPDVRLAVPGSDWVPGNELRCPQTRKTFLLPQRLPPLVATKLRPGSVESPYTGRSFDIPAAQWFPGAKVECPITRRIFLLPAELPDKQWPGTVVSAGVARSPYGSHQEVAVPGTEWLAGASISCPETGRHFLLPDKLPPLPALVDAAAPGEAHSPYLPAGDARGTVRVAIRDWQPRFTLNCPVTRLPFHLPDDLPVWEGVASIPSNQPAGTVESPYRPKTWVKVPPLQWLPGERLQCTATKRFFTLPDQLPLLEGRVVDAGRGIVASPFVDTGHTQTVPEEQWQPEGELACQETGRSFRLPRKLGALKKKAPPPVVAKVPDPEELDAQARKKIEKAGKAKPAADTTPGTERKRPNILPWALGALAAALAVGGYVFLKPDDQIAQQTEDLVKNSKLPEPVKDEVTDRAKYVLEEAALRDAFSKNDASAITTAFDTWNSRWQNLVAAEKDDTRKVALLLERQSILREGKRWTVDELKDAVTKLDGWKKPADAERFISEARASGDPGMVQAAWALAFSRAGSSGSALEAVLADAWAEIKSGKAPAFVKTAFVERAAALPQTLLGEVLDNKSSFQPDEVRPFIAKAKDIPDLKDKALIVEAQISGMPAGDPKLRLTYLEAARSGSHEARDWLFKNVIAALPKDQAPSAPGTAPQGFTMDPFAGPTAKPIAIPAAQWKPGAQITLQTPSVMYFSLPDEKTLPPLRAQVASLGTAPSEDNQWTGRVPNPFGTSPDLAIKKSEWYPGAEVPSPENPLLRVVLPEKDFPLLQTTKATDVEIARKEFKGEPGNAKIIHPLTDQLIEIAWTQWKPGNRITADAKGNKCPPFMLRNGTPEELDPQLECREARIASTGSAFSGGVEHPREATQARSPYTGEWLIVPLEQWSPGALAEDSSPMLKAAGVKVAMKLPATLAPVPAYKSGTGAEGDMSGDFQAWDEATGVWKEVKFRSSGKSDKTAYELYVENDGVVESTDGGRKFVIKSELTVRTVGSEYSDAKDPVSGEVMDWKTLKRVYAALSGRENKPGGVAPKFSPDAEKRTTLASNVRSGVPVDTRDKPTQTMVDASKQTDGTGRDSQSRAPQTNGKTTGGSSVATTGGGNQARQQATNGTGKASTPPPTTGSPGGGTGFQGNSIIGGRGGFAGNRFQKQADGSYRSSIPLRTQFSSDSDRIKDVRIWLKQSGFPSGVGIAFDSSGRVIVRP